MTTTLTNALGYAEATAKLADGTTEAVQVHAVPIRQIAAYAAALDKPHAVVELCCRKPEGWADGLTDDSLYELDELARNINDPRLARWFKRQNVVAAQAEQMLPAGFASRTPSQNVPASSG